MVFWRGKVREPVAPSREADLGLALDAANQAEETRLLDRRNFCMLSTLAAVGTLLGVGCDEQAVREEIVHSIDTLDGGGDVSDASGMTDVGNDSDVVGDSDMYDDDIFDARDNPDFEGEVVDDGGEVCDPNEYEGAGPCHDGCIPEAFKCPDGDELIDVCKFETKQELEQHIDGYVCEDGSRPPSRWMDCRTEDPCHEGRQTGRFGCDPETATGLHVEGCPEGPKEVNLCDEESVYTAKRCDDDSYDGRVVCDYE